MSSRNGATRNGVELRARLRQMHIYEPLDTFKNRMVHFNSNSVRGKVQKQIAESLVKVGPVHPLTRTSRDTQREVTHLNLSLSA
jgi:hypothetical protein